MVSTAEAEVLRTAISRIRRGTGLPVAFGGTLTSTGRTVRLTSFAGTLTTALTGLLITAGHGLGGQVIVTAQPGRVNDYLADPRISHEYDQPVTIEGLRAIAAVPVTMGTSVLGLLYAGTRESLPVGGRALDAMSQVARRAGNDLTVRREVERRLAALDTAVTDRATGNRPSGPEWEDVRQAHADLRTIANEVTDPVLRTRLREVCDRLSGSQTSGSTDATPNPLSRRELDVLTLVALGCGNAETAGRLGILPETVKSYLRNAMHKLNTHNRTETVVTARRLGYLP
jgi:DNA-binding CsgD family transcriptional regulator